MFSASKNNDASAKKAEPDSIGARAEHVLAEDKKTQERLGQVLDQTALGIETLAADKQRLEEENAALRSRVASVQATADAAQSATNSVLGSVHDRNKNLNRQVDSFVERVAKQGIKFIAVVAVMAGVLGYAFLHRHLPQQEQIVQRQESSPSFILSSGV